MTQLPLDLGFRPALGRADFLIAPCNAAAVAWIDRWPQWPGTALALWGPEGSGKTHLVEVWRARSGAARIEPLALTSTQVPGLLGAARAVAVDDADTADEEALLHLFNVLAERQGHLLLAARAPPGRRKLQLADLRSRLLASPAVAVAAPDDALLGAVLVKLFADRQLRIGEDLIAYLLPRLERSFAAAQEIVAALDQAALAGQRAITVKLARDIINRAQTPDRG
ncbi:MAG TPA: DNA replication protein [Stellaceae bacterium]|nr:DNA replication protein [Stellaceae bacterium]